MNLTNREADIIFAIMRELSGEFSHDEVRTRVGNVQPIFVCATCWFATISAHF